MKKSIMTIVLAFGLTGAANAEPFSTMAVYLTTHSMAAYAATHSELRECDKLPNLRVRHADGRNNVISEVTACDYQAKADRLVVVE